MSVTATDPSGVASVRASVAGANAGTTELANVGGNVYRAQIGPFESPVAGFGVDLPVHVVVTGTDTRGNTATATGSLTIRCSA
ncbi:MAG TPA: hypothetical protein VM390_11940 [Acidimicrobiales bacterium]|nr:hypothetical protein [Acidimicrobiales bacterium]